MIDKCSFGVMVINGKMYSSDLIIYPDGRVADHWRRQSGHRLSSDDIDSLIQSKPEVIVAGMGASGMMKPEPELGDLLQKNNITLIAEPNDRAIKTFNALLDSKKVSACFHLTC
ncbi:MAG: hypothetical protein JRG81_05490 [Deltaproteobacteria bacterium]|nr:hypothetical protein [Deltaproteobacteria bacterium]